MQKKWIMVGVILVGGGLLSQSILAGQPPASRPQANKTAPRPQSSKAQLDRVVEGNNRFAFELLRQLGKKKRKKNLFLSPYSISTALAMTYAGARGQTAKEMAQTLHFPLPQQKLHATFAQLMAQVKGNKKKQGYELVTANRLWGQHDFRFLPSFLGLLKRRYGAGLQRLNFKKAAPRKKARETINRWVAQQTKNKIKNLLGPNALNTYTRLVLTNAIYFKSPWANTFSKKATKKEVFWAEGTRKIRVPMMRQTDRLSYKKVKDADVLVLPYRRCELSMVLVLPHKKTGWRQVEQQLSSSRLKQWTQKMMHARVQLFLPRFRFSSKFALKPTLSQMGLQTAFTRRANFSGMTGKKKLKIDKVIHQAFVDVNEKGTEAAAATAMSMGLLSLFAKPRLRPFVFRVDRPFFFAIRHNQTQSILFLGRVANPSK